MTEVSKSTGILASIFLTVFFAGCAGDPEPYDAVQDIRKADELAEKSMHGQNYRKGISILEALQTLSLIHL